MLSSTKVGSSLRWPISQSVPRRQWNRVVSRFKWLRAARCTRLATSTDDRQLHELFIFHRHSRRQRGANRFCNDLRQQPRDCLDFPKYAVLFWQQSVWPALEQRKCRERQSKPSSAHRFAPLRRRFSSCKSRTPCGGMVQRRFIVCANRAQCLCAWFLFPGWATALH